MERRLHEKIFIDGDVHCNVMFQWGICFCRWKSSDYKGRITL